MTAMCHHTGDNLPDDMVFCNEECEVVWYDLTLAKIAEGELGLTGLFDGEAFA